MKNYFFPAFVCLGVFVMTVQRVNGQCCPVGTSGVVETTSTRDGTAAAQGGAGTGVSWSSIANAADPDGSLATNVSSGLGIGIILAAVPRPVTVSIPAFAIPAGSRFCSASIVVTASYSASGLVVLLPYANLTATLPAGGLSQANVTAGFNLVITGVYGFTGIGTITLRLDGVRLSVVTQAGCPLPAELIDFSGQQEQMCAGLQWSTASEKDNDFFTVEKLIGHDWIEIAKVDSRYGTTQTQTDYEFTDCDVSSMNYYRLSQTDRNGAREVIGENISVPIEMESPNEVIMFPNPAETVTCFATEQLIKSVRIIDMNGEIVGELRIPEYEQDERVCLPVDDLVKGIYMVQVETSKGICTKKLVVR